MLREEEYSFGYILRHFRKENHITQSQLARRLGVTVNTVHVWETRSSRPSMYSLMQLSDLMQLPMERLLQGARRGAAGRNCRREDY